MERNDIAAQAVELTNILGAVLPVHQFAIAGGFARDWYHGVLPKDIDVLVLVDAACAAIEQVAQGLLAHGYVDTSSHSGDEYEDNTFTAVLQFSKPGCLDVDICVSPQDTLMQAVHTLDHNLNMFVLDLDGAPRFLGRNLGVLHCTADRVSDERKAYMQTKARELGWITPINPSEVI